MPLVFDLTSSRSWINLTDLMNFGGIEIIPRPTASIGVSIKSSIIYGPDNMVNAAAVALSIASLGLFGRTASRFLKSQIAEFFFSELKAKTAQWKTNEGLEGHIAGLVSDYAKAAFQEKKYYAIEFCAAAVDLVGSAILIGGYLFAAPQIMTLGGIVVLLGVISGIYNYSNQKNEATSFEQTYSTIFYLAKEALSDLEQFDGEILLPKPPADKSTSGPAIVAIKPNSELTDQVLQHFKELS